MILLQGIDLLVEPGAVADAERPELRALLGGDGLRKQRGRDQREHQNRTVHGFVASKGLRFDAASSSEGLFHLMLRYCQPFGMGFRGIERRCRDFRRWYVSAVAGGAAQVADLRS
jgi:hypothetical protein